MKLLWKFVDYFILLAIIKLLITMLLKHAMYKLSNKPLRNQIIKYKLEIIDEIIKSVRSDKIKKIRKVL